MTHVNATAVGLFNTLTGATALTGLLTLGTAGVFQDLAPEGAVPPYVVFNAQSPSVPQYTYTAVAFENTIYQVKGVTQGPSKAAGGTIAHQIDAALNDAAVTVTGYTLLKCRRLQDVDFTEVVSGVRFSHIGGLFRVWVDPT